jgi:hypothetical protein
VAADDEIERTLGRYRPAGPPAALRTRLLSAGSPDRRLERRVLLATAAAALIAVAGAVLASRAYQDLKNLQASHAADARAHADEVVRQVLALGGDAPSAARILALEDQAARAAAEDADRRRYDSIGQ